MKVIDKKFTVSAILKPLNYIRVYAGQGLQRHHAETKADVVCAWQGLNWIEDTCQAKKTSLCEVSRAESPAARQIKLPNSTPGSKSDFSIWNG